jgi:predicted RNA-binding protein YlxR (DUF448 family)
MCIACRTRGEKSAFIRVGEGRGAYICRDPKCLKIATKKNSFSRALRGKVGDEIYEKLEREITGRDALDTSEGNS